jgi:cyclic di-GMP phosphodiesterase
MADQRILVVDDEEAIRNIVCAMLRSDGYECVEAGSGAEALAILQNEDDFQLVVSDLVMPQLDGVGLMQQLKRRFPEMPVVLVTAVHDISVALDALRKGAYDYLLKPFEREQLLATVRRALETYRLRVDNRIYQSNLEALVEERTQQLSNTLNDLERSYDSLLEALGDVLDLKDAETVGHCRRVTAYTIEIARAMQIPDETMNTLARGAFLHDIGKMAIPDAVLRKPGRLDESEKACMKEHSYLGYKMLKKIPFLSDVAEIVYAHQEYWDGSGYPRGLKGEEIPLGARIFAVADTLDAITSDRPYRPARGVEVAREEISKYSGRQFDPSVVKIFLDLPASTWKSLHDDVDSQTDSFRGALQLSKQLS